MSLSSNRASLGAPKSQRALIPTIEMVAADIGPDKPTPEMAAAAAVAVVEDTVDIAGIVDISVVAVAAAFGKIDPVRTSLPSEESLQ
jgi:hypothetical protein